MGFFPGWHVLTFFIKNFKALKKSVVTRQLKSWYNRRMPLLSIREIED